MEDHETRRKIIREWMALPKDKRHTEEQLWHSPKRRSSKTSSDAIRTTNFGAIRTRKSWDGSYLALASRDERHVGVWNHRHLHQFPPMQRGASF